MNNRIKNREVNEMRSKIATGLLAAVFIFGTLIPQVNAGDSEKSGVSMGKMKYDSFLELVKKRRSIRNYKPDPVPDDYIKKIVEAARWAPSGFNSQPWEFVVVRKPELKDRIVKILSGGSSAKAKPAAKAKSQSHPVNYASAPALILVLGDTRVRDFGPGAMRTDEVRWQSTYVPSLSVAYQQMALAATSLGLGSQWLSALIGNEQGQKQIRELIGIPEEMEFFHLFFLGFPDEEPRDKKMRPLEEMLHFDDCGIDDFRTRDEVKAFFSRGQ